MEEMKDGAQKLNREQVSAVTGGAGAGGSTSFTVVFTSAKHIASFCVAARNCEGSVTITQGSKSVNGKMVLQVMTLEQNQPATVRLSNAEDRQYLSGF